MFSKMRNHFTKIIYAQILKFTYSYIKIKINKYIAKFESLQAAKSA